MADQTTKQDLGNNETRALGCTGPDAEGMFLALTSRESKYFKTRKGAYSWLGRRGYNPDGSKMVIR